MVRKTDGDASEKTDAKTRPCRQRLHGVLRTRVQNALVYYSAQLPLSFRPLRSPYTETPSSRARFKRQYKAKRPRPPAPRCARRRESRRVPASWGVRRVWPDEILRAKRSVPLMPNLTFSHFSARRPSYVCRTAHMSHDTSCAFRSLLHPKSIMALALRGGLRFSLLVCAPRGNKNEGFAGAIAGGGWAASEARRG